MSKILARAFVKLALKEDKQITINTANSAQCCGAEHCDLSMLSDGESKELKEWMQRKDAEFSAEVQD